MARVIDSSIIMNYRNSNKSRVDLAIENLQALGIVSDENMRRIRNAFIVSSEEATEAIVPDEENNETVEEAKENSVTSPELMKAILESLDKLDIHLKKVVQSNPNIVETTGSFRKTEMNKILQMGFEVLEKVYIDENGEDDERLRKLKTLFTILNNGTLKRLVGGSKEPFIYEGYQLILLECLFYMVSLVPTSIDKNKTVNEIIEENPATLIVFHTYMKMLDNITSPEYIKALGTAEFIASSSNVASNSPVPVSETPYVNMPEFDKYFISREAAEKAIDNIDQDAKEMGPGVYKAWCIRRRRHKELNKILKQMRKTGITSEMIKRTCGFFMNYVDWATSSWKNRGKNFIGTWIVFNKPIAILSAMILETLMHAQSKEFYVTMKSELVPYIDKKIDYLSQTRDAMVKNDQSEGLEEIQRSLNDFKQLKKDIMDYRSKWETSGESMFTSGESIINAMNIKNSGNVDIFLSILNAIATTAEMLCGVTMTHRYQMIEDVYGLMYESNTEVRNNKLDALLHRMREVVTLDITRRQGLQRAEKLESVNELF